MVSTCSFRYEEQVRTSVICATFALITVIPLSASAHNKFEVDALLGYRLGGAVDVGKGDDAGELTFDGAPSLGFILGYRAQPDGFAFLSYSRQQTSAEFDLDNDGDNAADFSTSVSVESFQLGGNLESTHGIFVPYLGASVGLTRLTSLDDNNDKFFFAAAFDGGVKLDIHEHVHLRFLGRIPITFAKGSFLCGAEGACRRANELSLFTQLELMAGVGASF